VRIHPHFWGYNLISEDTSSFLGMYPHPPLFEDTLRKLDMAINAAKTNWELIEMN